MTPTRADNPSSDLAMASFLCDLEPSVRFLNRVIMSAILGGLLDSGQTLRLIRDFYLDPRFPRRSEHPGG